MTQFPLHLKKNPWYHLINPWISVLLPKLLPLSGCPSPSKPPTYHMSSLQCIDKFLLPSWNLWWRLLCSKASLLSLDSLSYLMSLKYKAQVFQNVVLHNCSFDFPLLSSPLVMGSEQENHIEKNEIMPFAATWMGLEIIILSKSERDKYCFYAESTKMIQMNLFTKQKQTHRLREQTSGFRCAGRWGGVERVEGKDS